jgi:hypothetical protein
MSIPFISTFILFIKNLWILGAKLPGCLEFVVPIVQIIGSEEFRKMAKSIYDSVIDALSQLRKESPEIPKETKTLTEPQRVRIVDRLKRRVGLAWIGISEDEFVAFENYKNNHNETIV